MRRCHLGEQYTRVLSRCDRCSVEVSSELGVDYENIERTASPNGAQGEQEPRNTYGRDGIWAE